MTAAFLNGAAGWIITITYCFCISAMDLDEVVSSPTVVVKNTLYS